jgi:hypothetical protein
MSGLRLGFQSFIAVAAVIMSLVVTSSAEAGRGHSGGYGGGGYGGGHRGHSGGHFASYGGGHGGMRVAYNQPVRMPAVRVVRSYGGGGYGGGYGYSGGHSGHGHAARLVAYSTPVRYVQPIIHRQAYVTHTSRRHARCACN